jgi:ABC-type nitrate/sulfonate/bicarbonate transport system substrate-binding protein
MIRVMTLVKPASVFICVTGSLLLLVAWAQAQPTPLKFVYSGTGGSTDVIKFSNEGGYFRKRGADLTMIYVTSGVITAQTVVSGTAAAAAGTITDMLRALAAGAAMKITMVTTDRFDSLFVSRAGITNPAELRGKKVAVSRYGSFSDIQTRFVIRQLGMEPDRDVQIVQVGNTSARAAALVGGAIDGALMSPSFIPVVQRNGLSVLYDLSTLPNRFAVIGLVVNNRLIDEQPHLVKALVAGYTDGIRAWRNNPASAKAYLKKSYKTSDAEVDTVYAEINRFLLLEPSPNLDSIRNTWDSMPDLKGRKDIDLSKFVESKFVDEALRALR